MLQLATAASAIAVTRPGASISIPSRTEVEEALNQGVLKKLEVKEQ
jgi:sugar/nucleoside kinase (ribokinase family)